METETKSTSPFQDIPKNKTTANPEQFSFQTMQDDLLNLQKIETPQKDGDIQKITTTKEAPIAQTQKPFNSVDTSSKEINPFILGEGSKGPFDNHISIKDQPKNNPDKKIKLIEIIIVFLVLCLICLGIYYFWITRNTEQPLPVVQQPAEITPPIKEQPAVIEIPTEKYSATKPNYFALDLTNLSSTEIQSSLFTLANELKETPSNFPYEFVLVDNNNNPIAFPIFATAAKLNLLPSLLSSLGEDFSLFIYIDAGNTRLGFSASILKSDTINTELQKQEATFSTDASFLFLNAIPEIQSGTFTTTDYNGNTVHYLNLNQQKDLSVDYTITDSQLIISTSKNTQRAIIDKLSQAIILAPQQQSQPTTTEIPTENIPSNN